MFSQYDRRQFTRPYKAAQLGDRQNIQQRFSQRVSNAGGVPDYGPGGIVSRDAFNSRSYYPVPKSR